MKRFWLWLVSIWHWIRPYGLSPKPKPVTVYTDKVVTRIVETNRARTMNGITVPGGDEGQRFLAAEAAKIMGRPVGKRNMKSIQKEHEAE